MTMTCVNCEHIVACKDARPSYVCDRFSYVQYLAHRTRLTHILGEDAAIYTLVKGKNHMVTDHPNTANLKTLVAEGNIPALNVIRDPDTMPLPYLVMAASHLVGDSNKIGKLLKASSSKRDTLVDILVELAQENVSAEPTPADEPPFDTAPVEPEPAPAPVKKKRRRRTKAQIEADRAAKAAEDAAREAQAAEPSQSPAKDASGAPIVLHSPGAFDFHTAFMDVLSEIEKSRDEANVRLEVAVEHIKYLEKRLDTVMTEFKDLSNQVDDRVGRLKGALAGLEEQFTLTGVVLEPTVNSAFED